MSPTLPILMSATMKRAIAVIKSAIIIINMQQFNVQVVSILLNIIIIVVRS